MYAAINVAITRCARAGAEAEYERALRQFLQRSLDCEGTTGAQLLLPCPGSDDREFGILRSFRSEEDRERFYASDLFREFMQEVEPLVEGEPTFRDLHGLEAFFRGGGGAHPPRWKMAIVTWLGVFPAVLFWSWLTGLVAGGLPLPARVLLVTLAVVPTLTWGLMPRLVKAFGGWLRG